MKKFLNIFCLFAIVGNTLYGQDFPETKWIDYADTDWYNTTDDTYEILTPEGLAGLSVLVANGTSFEGKTIDILSDIDLGTHLFQPIGTDINHPFKGTVMGNNHIISNLRINQTDKDFAGLFGAVLNSEFFNIILDNAIVYGKSTVGALVANLSTNSHLESSYAVNSEVRCEPGFYGGIAGGLVGGLLSGSSVKLCSFSGAVYGGDQIGGLVGTTWDTTLIEQSYSEGIVHGDNIVGGLVGYTTMNFPPFPGTTNVVKNCFSASNVIATGEKAGGLFGFPETNGRIENSYSIGTVQAASGAGALVGAIMGDTQVINSYFDSENSGMTDGIGEFGGPVQPEITAMNTADMKTEAFAITLNTDDETIWYQNDNVNDGYPFFSAMFLSTDEPQLNSESANIYPTLSRSLIFIDSKSKSDFLIVDINGQLITKGNLNAGINTVNTSSFNKGVYIIVIHSESGKSVKRFVKL